ncbi:hypothetical protein QJS04_geneDACA014539 [Acorus gramineus]|uniref:Uncharacterized protein n=1 Tax=Acorus gramineus TaxID=55184 RepID=A0AAV9APQ7_ACOGR|nr:hypothetical protein QJS04_geneDACA014539 [Acorus gramineus]
MKIQDGCHPNKEGNQSGATSACVIQLSVTRRGLQHRSFKVLAVTEGSAKSSSKSDDNIPSWARPYSDEPPLWAGDEGKESSSELAFEVPFHIYLLTSAITAIVAAANRASEEQDSRDGYMYKNIG